MNRQRVAVIGIGAIGGAVAADLADLGRHDVTLCTRTPFERLEVEHPSGISRPEAQVATTPQGMPPADWVLLATKAHQSASARPWLDALCGPATRLAILQNGVDHVERITPLVAPGTTLVPVVVQIPAERKAPGRVELLNDGLLFVPDDAAGTALAALFEGARTRVKPTPDLASQAWWKLLNNAALGGVCALTLRENGAAGEPRMRSLVLSIMREVLAVARAEGAELPDDAPEKALDLVLRAAAGHSSSITVDRREGRRMEWEARNQVVGERGRRHGIPTPLNDAITVMLEAADAGSGAG